VVTAFTLGIDHAAQLAVWRQVKDNSYIQPYTVRRLLTETAVPLDSQLGSFVGAEAYKAAGGKVTRDLFSADEDGFLDDAALVRRLAIEKLEQKAAELRPVWAWTKAVLDPEYGSIAQYGRMRPQPAELPPEIAAEIESIEQCLGELEETPEDSWTEELMQEAAQLEERRDQLAETAEGLAVYAEKDRARAGCIVTIGDDGDFHLYEGLVERSASRGEAAAHAGEDDGDEAPASAPSEDEDDDPGPGPSSASAEQAVRKECGFSQLLVDDLKAHRLQIARAHLAGDFGVAFDLALYSLCVDLFEQFAYRSHPLDLRAIESELHSSLNDLSGTPAHHLLEARCQVLDLDWLKLPPAEGFAALSALPAAAKQRLFAWCIASCLKPQLEIEDRADPVVESAGRRLAIPFADFWRPTTANYWGRVKKAHGLAIAKAILGPRWARDHADAKKPILAAALEKAFDPADNTAAIGLDRAARDGAAAWPPPGIAYAEDRGDGADPQPGGTTDVEEFEAEAAEIGLTHAELPAFLTEDEAAGDALDGASAP
jgi:ParB family transcriptional regulator, chromosome partitioning protein